MALCVYKIVTCKSGLTSQDLQLNIDNIIFVCDWKSNVLFQWMEIHNILLTENTIFFN